MVTSKTQWSIVKRLFLVPCAIASILMSLTSCGESEAKRVPVAGVVLIDGEPLEGGTIRFVPEQGRPGSSTILDDGSFEIAAESIDKPFENGLPLGIYRVEIASSEIVDDETIIWKAPQHYADFRTSGLEVVINNKNEALTIELVSEGSKEDSAKVENNVDPESKAIDEVESSKIPADTKSEEAEES
ncbi:hypothetical protein [Bythopirellula goksoeyrii]|uniref:Carboxypeptidase regulatory-like domain-containing protein n=1 Tax=Bythopirellula goksoeyrii TaxID=1400387 RepID=A0A5B9QFW8_9BACT|nr:hypothetical protein [Bythopirellula goksoeyrii]QEG36462.1 hypothetical protein Pr1d_37760 [Bythopirellula goksoeyrii]